MAYGVKYRLEFSDDELKGKKIEILKKNFVKYPGKVMTIFIIQLLDLNAH